jgi:hypothetical protein
MKKVISITTTGAAGLSLALLMGACAGHPADHAEGPQQGGNEPTAVPAPQTWAQAANKALNDPNNPNSFTATDEHGTNAVVQYVGYEVAGYTTADAPTGVQVPLGDEVVLSVFIIQNKSTTYQFDATNANPGTHSEGSTGTPDVLTGLSFNGVVLVDGSLDNVGGSFSTYTGYDQMYSTLNANGTALSPAPGDMGPNVSTTSMIVAVSVVPAGKSVQTLNGGNWTVTAPKMSIPIGWLN